jgi:hypothetical protein
VCNIDLTVMKIWASHDLSQHDPVGRARQMTVVRGSG